MRWDILCEQSFYKILPDECGAFYSGDLEGPGPKELRGFRGLDSFTIPLYIGLFAREAILVTKAINVIFKVWCDWCTWDPAPACRNQLQWRALAQGLWPLTFSSQLRLTLKCSQWDPVRLRSVRIPMNRAFFYLCNSRFIFGASTFYFVICTTVYNKWYPLHSSSLLAFYYEKYLSFPALLEK